MTECYYRAGPHRGRQASPGDRAVHYELIDPANGYLPGDENIAVTPLLGLPPGSVSYNDRVSSGWTDARPSQPAH